MKVPPGSHIKWKELLSGSEQYAFAFFPLKMAIGRLQNLIANQTVDQHSAIQELREIFKKNENLPKVQNDLKKIFG